MKMQDYSIMEKLRKTSTQISLLSLLIHSDEHHKALMKILNEAHVPDKITVNDLEKIANNIFEANMITFSHDELPMEETEYNRALYLTMKRDDSVVSRVLVDNVSSENISPLSTLQKLKIDTEIIHMNSVCVRGFDGGAEDDKGPWVYQIFKIVYVEKIPEGECIPSSKLSSASVMVANEMLKNGFVPGAAKRPISLVPKPVVDVDEELIKRFQSLFDEVNMVEIGKGSNNADVQFVRPNMKLSNWEATPLPTPKEPSLKSQYNSKIIIQEVEIDEELEYDEEAAFEEISKELKHFEEKPKLNLNETEAINLGNHDNVWETKICVHLEPQFKEEIIITLLEYKDVFAWSYDDMLGLSIDLIKEEITKRLGAKVIRVTEYPIWLANVVLVPKKDGKTRVCVDYRDLNKASPKDDFPLPNIHILIDKCAKHEIGSFMDCYAGYNQILMDEEDAEKIAFITPRGIYCNRVMPFGLKNAGATYIRAMTIIFHDMIHKEIDVYVDDVIIKSKKQSDIVKDLRKFFQRLCRYNLKLNLAKCAFGVPSGKLLGFVVSQCGIELDPLKIKAIQELPLP
ncbi:uncharacterized protein [Nicotiana sylvestris]|uniref:uncharacterized protein n=1 Tax=Nicotiana sylvestris TaxID=4096 RepID=UPI00388CA6D2